MRRADVPCCAPRNDLFGAAGRQYQTLGGAFVFDGGAVVVVDQPDRPVAARGAADANAYTTADSIHALAQLLFAVHGELLAAAVRLPRFIREALASR